MGGNAAVGVPTARLSSLPVLHFWWLLSVLHFWWLLYIYFGGSMFPAIYLFGHFIVCVLQARLEDGVDRSRVPLVYVLSTGCVAAITSTVDTSRMAPLERYARVSALAAIPVWVLLGGRGASGPNGRPRCWCERALRRSIGF